MNGIASIADILALESEHSGLLPDSTYEMIGAAARAHPDAPALSFFARVEDHARPEIWTYKTLFSRITATANFLHELGVGANDVVAFALPNLPQTHLAIWGGQAAGIAFAINPMLEPAAIVELLAAGEAKVLITLRPVSGTDLWPKLQPLLGRVRSLEHVVLVDLAGQIPGVKGKAKDGFKIHDFEQGLRLQPVDRLISERVIHPGDRSSYFCTGGTTGAPKIAMRTHANEVANAWSIGRFLGDGIAVGKTLFCGLPLFHVNGVLVTGLLPFSRGAHVILGTPAGYRGDGVIKHFWELVEHHRINFFSGVPTVYAALMQQPTQGRDLSSLEYGLCGAAPMPLELMRSFQESTGLKILEGYGLTEGTCASTCNPPLGERRTGSIGLRVPLQAMKAVVLDDAGAYVRDCAVGEAGVLAISGPNVFAGYRDPDQGKGLWPDLGDGRRWLNTGDLGRQDADGYFYLTGRRKELIIRGGHNIDPASIEEPLHRHPAVQLAAAVGRPDVHAGELPVAYVQLRPDVSVTEDELMSFAKVQITERAAVPKAIRLVTAMPLTGVGKIFKPELRQREIADALRTALHDAAALTSRLEVINDPRLGIQIEVALADGAAAGIAREVLGQFPFRFDVSWTSGDR
ncbi:acyl-CoA synthetase [Variovorax ginsengisoli]|uniref:Acyl-CoA synthetase n=1 Tax=Variovorax ginsengisoli TaxID=363844 RepID=A0ABT8S291_9BURK|nr:acyl-CoA synthetase [Variovorax ginsengisoli]MDN8613660.1 acyl-CoA synthetase [Variovorax ginsengisoli]MDO1532830.1 acyl-CoA synthetase [Variovorax ginsengisoli]